MLPRFLRLGFDQQGEFIYNERLGVGIWTA